MRFLITCLFILNCLISIHAEETTTILPQSNNQSDEIKDDNIEPKNSLANKPFLNMAADPSRLTTERRSTTTNKPRLSVYALINAKKQTKKTKAGKCNCFGETSTIIRYIKVLNDELELGDVGNLDCASSTDASNRCEQLCREKASIRFGEEVDLKRPYSLKDDKIEIGQELCRQVGSVILPSHLKIKSHIVCPGAKFANYRDTGLKSKQKFVCVLGRFHSIVGLKN